MALVPLESEVCWRSKSCCVLSSLSDEWRWEECKIQSGGGIMGHMQARTMKRLVVQVCCLNGA